MIPLSVSKSAGLRTALPDGLWRSRSTATLLAFGDRACRSYTVYNRVLARVKKTRLAKFEQDTLAVRSEGEDRLELEAWGPVTRTQYDRVYTWPDVPRLGGDHGWLSDPGLTVDAYFEMLAGHFAFAAERGIDWASLRTQCDAALARDPAAPDRLFDALVAVLKRLEDGHGSLKGHHRRADSRPWSPRLYQAWSAACGRPFDEDASDGFGRDWFHHVHRRILARAGRTAARDNLAWGRLKSGVGYLALMLCESLSKDGGGRADVAAATAALDHALADLAGARGVIVDLRFNEGGWDRVAVTLARRFTDSETPVFTKQAVRSGVALQPQTIAVTPASGPRYSGPVAVLTSDATVSAAEVAALALRALPNTRSFGHPTYGALSDALSYRLPNGWKGTVSNEIYRAADGHVYEGVGIPPDQPSLELSANAFWETVDAPLRDAEAWLLAS
jgi:hypothetical protein